MEEYKKERERYDMFLYLYLMEIPALMQNKRI